MIKFNNEILDELSLEGKQYLGSHLQTYLSTLQKEDRANTAVGLRIAVDTNEMISNSLSDLASMQLVDKRINCSIFFCVTLRNLIAREFEILPQHLTVEAFQNLERTLQHSNMYWKGSSMYVTNK